MMTTMDPKYLAFSLPFLLFSGDIWLHGPISSNIKHIGLVASLLAVPLQRVEAFVFAELVWLALVIFTQITEEGKVVKEDSLEKVEEEVETGPPALSSAAEKMILEGFEKFQQSLGEETCDKKKWKLFSKDEDITMYQADFPGKSIKRWKVTMELQASDLDSLMNQVSNFDVRFGPNGWDPSVKEGKVLQEFKGGKYSVSRVVTNPAGGGSVSSREMIDLRLKLTHDMNPDLVPKGGIMVSMIGLDPKKDKSKIPCLPNADKSLVLAMNQSGSGLKVYPIENKPGMFSYTLVSSNVLGGWIPTVAHVRPHSFSTEHATSC